MKTLAKLFLLALLSIAFTSCSSTLPSASIKTKRGSSTGIFQSSSPTGTDRASSAEIKTLEEDVR